MSILLFLCIILLSFVYVYSQPYCSPIVVGGTGGSGTRAIISFLEILGVKPPPDMNGPHDIRISDPCSIFEISKLVLEETKSLIYDPQELPISIRKKYQLCAQFLKDIKPKKEDRLWGFKFPKSMFLVPLLHETFPSMCYIHAVRDGRDMAFSDNSHQINVGGEHILSEFTVKNNEMLKAKFWEKTNLEVHKWSKKNLKDRYFLVRVEDLVFPENRYNQSKFLFENLGLSKFNNEEDLIEAMKIFQGSLSEQKADDDLTKVFGKWRLEDPELVREIQKVLKKGLEAFKYPIEENFERQKQSKKSLKSKKKNS